MKGLKNADIAWDRIEHITGTFQYVTEEFKISNGNFPVKYLEFPDG